MRFRQNRKANTAASAPATVSKAVISAVWLGAGAGVGGVGTGVGRGVGDGVGAGVGDGVDDGDGARSAMPAHCSWLDVGDVGADADVVGMSAEEKARTALRHSSERKRCMAGQVAAKSLYISHSARLHERAR